VHDAAEFLRLESKDGELRLAVKRLDRGRLVKISRANRE
jgi:hypothetical protein